MPKVECRKLKKREHQITHLNTNQELQFFRRACFVISVLWFRLPGPARFFCIEAFKFVVVKSREQQKKFLQKKVLQKLI